VRVSGMVVVSGIGSWMLDGVSVWGGLRAGLALLRDEKATNASPQVGSLDLRPAVRPSHFTFSGANLVEKHHFQAKYSNFSEPLSNHTSCIHNRSNNLSQSSLICRLSALAAASSDSSVFVLATECTSVNTIYFITNIKTTVQLCLTEHSTQEPIFHVSTKIALPMRVTIHPP